jgi:hypothetical protein
VGKSDNEEYHGDRRGSGIRFFSVAPVRSEFVEGGGGFNNNRSRRAEANAKIGESLAA